MAEEDPVVMLSEKIVLQAQVRVLEGYSATQAHHRWHDKDDIATIDVVDKPIMEVLRARDQLLASIPVRTGEEYRIVLVCSQASMRVI